MTTVTDMTMAELLENYPGAQRALFRHYHIGGCASCGFRADETLAEVCARNDGLDVEEVLENIRAAHEQDQRMMITPADLRAAMDRGQARVLDIRTTEEYNAVHIDGVTHFNQTVMQEVLGSPAKDALIVLLDHTGARALDAAAYFAGHGFTNVKCLRGGIDAWSVEVDPSLPRYTLE